MQRKERERLAQVWTSASPGPGSPPSNPSSCPLIGRPLLPLAVEPGSCLDNVYPGHFGAPRYFFRGRSAWAAITFEGVCWKHVDRITHGLSIGGVNTVASVWSYRACDKNQRGAQIDLLIDRADYCISVCEIKFSDTMFTITKSYAAELQAKLDVFRQQSGSRKTLFLVMIASSGCSENEHYQRLITSQLNLDDLF